MNKLSRFAFAVVAALACTFIACNSSRTEAVQSDTATVEKNEEWKSLSNSNYKNEWHSYGKDSLGKAWQLQDSALHLDASVKNDWQTKEGGDIVTNDEYENFDLKLEWKISKGGNSGIMLYVKEDTAKYRYPWETGLEMQVVDNEGHPDGKAEKTRAGAIYDLIPISKNVTKPAGEWNAIEIISNKGKLDFIMNGQNVLSTTLWDEAWKNLVANSKFKTMTDFGTFKKGKISLQDHGADVWYRNIEIKKL
jgi:hypothetical protein